MQHEQAAELLRRQFGRPVAPRLVEQLLRRTDADPTLLAEVVEQVDPDADGLHRVPLHWPQSEIDRVRSLLTGLGAAAYQVMASASVIGREFDLSILEMVCADVDVLGGLDEARAAGLIRPLPAQVYSFTRATTRDIVYDELPSRLRALLHERAAEALVDVGALGGARAVTVAELAHHTAEASLLGVGPDGTGRGRLDLAVAASATAGATAAADGADELAAGYYAQAALLAGRAGWEPGPAGRLLAAAGAARLRSAARPQTREVGRASLTGALRLGRRAADPGLLAVAAWGMGPRPTAGVFAPPDSAPDPDAERLVALAEAMAAQPASAEPALVARLTARLAGSSADPDLAARALSLARDGDDPRALAEALLASASLGSVPGLDLSTLPALATRLDDAELLARAYDALAITALRAADPAAGTSVAGGLAAGAPVVGAPAAGGLAAGQVASGYLERLAEMPAILGTATALTRWYALRARVEADLLNGLGPARAVRAPAGRERTEPAGGDLLDAVGRALAAGRLVDPLTAGQWHAAVSARLAAPSAGDPLDILTVREREVLNHALRGTSAKEIAQALVLGERTVETHLASIYRKLEVRTRIELIRRFGGASVL